MHLNFYYIRHGETLFNVTGRAQGWCDSPLTAQGIEQAKEAGKRLKKIRIDRAYSSSSQRAADTAEIVLQGKDVEVKVLKGLREMYFGTLEGSDIDRADEMTRCWKKKDFRPYGGENKDDFIARILKTFSEIVKEAKDKENILIVSHNGYFYYMLEALFGSSLEKIEGSDPDFLHDLVPNGSIAEFIYEDGRYELTVLPSKKVLPE